MTPTIHQRRVCCAEIPHYKDIDAYVSDLARSDIWGDGDDIPQERLDWLRDTYAVYTGAVSVRDIAAEAGLSYRKLAERFNIPYRTMEDWSSGKAKPPAYMLAMMQEILRGAK